MRYLPPSSPSASNLCCPRSIRSPIRFGCFGQARVAIGPHGSNFVNGVFSDRLSVVEFFQPEHVNWGVYSVLLRWPVTTTGTFCARASVDCGGPKRFADMRVDLATVEATLSRHTAGRRDLGSRPAGRAGNRFFRVGEREGCVRDGPRSCAEQAVSADAGALTRLGQCCSQRDRRQGHTETAPERVTVVVPRIELLVCLERRQHVSRQILTTSVQAQHRIR